MIPPRGPKTHFQQALRAKGLLTISVLELSKWMQVPLGNLGTQDGFRYPVGDGTQAAMEANPGLPAIGIWA